jgi:glycosyltransferase involved in cell wall biosynthesis
MNLWLLHAGWDVPLHSDMRLLRYGSLIREATKRNWAVNQWTPSFNHFQKKLIYDSDTIVKNKIFNNHKVYFVYAGSYPKNVSMRRLIFYQKLGKKFKIQAPHLPKPDVILVGIPSVEWCYEAAKFGRRHNIPVILDVRDLWPDLLLMTIPAKCLRMFGKVFLFHLYKKMRFACRNATAICGVSKSYVEWGIKKSDRLYSSDDRVFPLGYDLIQLPLKEQQQSLQFAISKGVDPQKKICIFSGQFGKLYDLETIVDAARLLENRKRENIQFVLCGDGSKMHSLKTRAHKLKNIIFLGWCDQKIVSAVNDMAKIGLVAYGKNALQSLPNKPFEYLAGGNALVSSLNGESEVLIKENRCGVIYKSGDARDCASKIETLIVNPDQLQEMCENSKRLFNSQYRMSTISSNFADYVEKVANQKCK